MSFKLQIGRSFIFEIDSLNIFVRLPLVGEAWFGPRVLTEQGVGWGFEGSWWSELKELEKQPRNLDLL